MTKDQQIAWQVAYDDGVKNGKADKLLGIQSEYVWAGVILDPPSSYTFAYSKGYRAGWLETKAWE